MIFRCFSCELENDEFPIVEGEKLVHCKSLNHDIRPELEPSEINRPEEKEDQTQIQKLLDFVNNKIKNISISESDSSKIYALVQVKDHLETIEIGSSKSIHWLKASYYSEKKEVFSDESYKAALDLILAQAPYSERVKTRPIFKRIAFENDEIFYDIGTNDWKLIHISKDNLCHVSHGIDIPLFVRSNNQSEQVEPNFQYQGNPLEEFRKFCRIDSPLFPIHIVSCFIENIPVPIMVITGEQGSAKSTTAGYVKMIIDPSGTNIGDQLSHFPKSIDDLNIHFFHNYSVAFDNVSYISDETSDTICKAITGAGYPKRRYYTDSEEINLKFRRKIIFNGITVNVEHGDLAERSILYLTRSIPENERRTEKELLEKFKRLLPDILGQIFVTLQKALRIYKEVEEELVNLPRMADYAIWGEAISRSLGNKPLEFLTAYKQSIESSNEILNENNPLVSFLDELVSSEETITVTAGQFYQKLESFADKEKFDKQGRNYPRSSNKLRGFFTRSKPLLDSSGYGIRVYKNTARNQFTPNTTLIEVKKLSSAHSAPSTPVDDVTDENPSHIDSWS